MKIPTYLVVGGLIVLAAAAGIRSAVQQAAAQQPAGGAKKPPATAVPKKDTADPHAKDKAALEQSAQAFAKAFNSGDAKAVAALWTKDGDYTNDAGERFAGRAAIEKQYIAFLDAHQGAKITIVIDNLKLLSDSAAIEDGRAVVEG